MVVALTKRGVRFREFAGNDEILLTALAPSALEFGLTAGDLLLYEPLLTNPGATRIAVKAPVGSLREVLAELARDGITLERLYDYLAANAGSRRERPLLSARRDERPARIGKRARAAAALLRVRVVCGARDHAAHDALGDGAKPEHRERETELPVGDGAAARTPAVVGDVV